MDPSIACKKCILSSQISRAIRTGNWDNIPLDPTLDQIAHLQKFHVTKFCEYMLHRVHVYKIRTYELRKENANLRIKITRNAMKNIHRSDDSDDDSDNS